MNSVPLEAIPNQTFRVPLDGSLWELQLKALSNVMVVTIKRDTVTLVENMRAVAGTPLIPYAYLEYGNFIFVTENDELPYWTQFGVTQSLIYLTRAETAGARSA